MVNILFDNHTHIGPFYNDDYDYHDVFMAMKNNGVNGAVVAFLTPLIDNVKLSIDFFNWMNQECKASSEYAKSIDFDAKILYWVEPLIFDAGLSLERIMENGPYAGFALHPFLHNWNPNDIVCKKRLNCVFDYAQKYRLPVYFHTGISEKDNPLLYEKWYKEYDDVEIHLAHCKDSEPIISLFSKYNNLYGDTAFCPADSYKDICKAGFKDRMLYGTDFPITHWWKYEKKEHKPMGVIDLTKNYKESMLSNAYFN